MATVPGGDQFGLDVVVIGGCGHVGLPLAIAFADRGARVGIYDTSDRDHLQLMSKVRTAVGGKTGLLMPQQKRLIIVASPGDTKATAKVLFYAIQ